VDLPDHFAASVLAQTSGKTCDRTLLLLVEAEAEQSAASELLPLHLESCAHCAAVAHAWTQVLHTLPLLAEGDPDPNFVGAVLAATAGSRKQRVVSPRAWLGRIQHRLIRRPRIALEGAFVMALLLLVAFGLPSRSLVDLPMRAIVVMSRDSAASAQAVKSATGEVVRLGRSGWLELNTHTGAAVEQISDWVVTESGEQLRALSGATGTQMQNVWGGLLAPNVEQIRSLWNEKATDPVEPDTANQTRP
jgi:hypothetical protein